MAKELIMVMGVQRSGTSVLLNSLATDKRLTTYKENADNAIYYQYRLRPLAEIALRLNDAPGPVLLKPLSETFYRPLEALLLEYKDYAVRIIWIYRDPVNVVYSMCREGWVPFSDIQRGLDLSQWLKRNRLALEFEKRHADQITIVRYEDCVADPKVFQDLTAQFGLNCKSLFRRDSGEGRRNVPVEVQRQIDTLTSATLRALDDVRAFKARAFYRWKHAMTQAASRWGKVAT